jgi:hypothetical protein
MGQVREDDHAKATTGFVPLASGPHWVEFDWMASSGPGAKDGAFRLWIDGAAVAELDAIDNSLSAVDFVRLGALSVKVGASGTIYWDEFESRRLNYIGP